MYNLKVEKTNLEITKTSLFVKEGVIYNLNYTTQSSKFLILYNY